MDRDEIEEQLGAWEKIEQVLINAQDIWPDDGQMNPHYQKLQDVMKVVASKVKELEGKLEALGDDDNEDTEED